MRAADVKPWLAVEDVADRFPVDEVRTAVNGATRKILEGTGGEVERFADATDRGVGMKAGGTGLS
jgi:hypothetical protein